jgi:hypothetical protein
LWTPPPIEYAKHFDHRIVRIDVVEHCQRALNDDSRIAAARFTCAKWIAG